MSNYESIFWVVFVIATVAFLAFIISQWKHSQKH